MFLGITLLSLLGLVWAMEGCVDSIAARHNASVTRIFFLNAFMVVLVGLALLPFQKEHIIWQNRQYQIVIISILFAGFLTYVANYFLFRSMARGPNGIIWSIYQGSMLLPFIFGITLHRDPVSIMRLLGIGILFIGLMALGIGGDRKKKTDTINETENFKKKKNHHPRWLLPCTLSFLCNGFCMYTTSLPSRFIGDEINLSSVSRSTLLNIGIVLGCLAHPNFRRDLFKCPTKQEGFLAFCLTLFCLVGYYALQFPGIDLLTEAGAGSIAFTIPVGICVIAFTLYSAIRLKEQYSLLEWSGLALCTTGVVVLSC